MKKILLTVALLLGANVPASAASFNCAYAKLPTEVLICQDEALSKLDEDHSRLFYLLRNTLNSKEQRDLDAGDRTWLSQRNTCGYDKSCVNDRYLDHIEHLCGQVDNDKIDLSDGLCVLD